METPILKTDNPEKTLIRRKMMTPIPNSEYPKALAHLSRNLIQQIMEISHYQTIPAGTEILRAGQYVKVIPIVTDGLIKVFNRFEDKELLLYYIRPDESCIMSFSASLHNDPSKVYAATEEDTTALLIPADKISQLVHQHPDINSLFFQQYNLRYSELLDTIHHILFRKMDVRLYDYLKEKSLLTGKDELKVSHRQIASELGTAREVITRVMKKLEQEGKVSQQNNSIRIL